MLNNVLKVTIAVALTMSLSGCFLTKVVTTPMRVVGATASVVGAVVSIVPVAGTK